MLRTIYLSMALFIVVVPSLSYAGVAEVSPALRGEAEALCQSDALRLCAEAVPDETAIVACMRPKRSELTPSCRKVFDEVVRAVRR